MSYQVVAECAYVTVDGPTGRSLQLLLKGAPVPADAPELERLVNDGYVAKLNVDESELGGVDAAGIPQGAYTTEVPEAITSTPVPKSEEQMQADREADERTRAAAELEEKRAAARQKLTELGGEPDGRSSQAVWVEYMVGRGQSYDDVKDTSKAELQKLAERQK